MWEWERDMYIKMEKKNIVYDYVSKMLYLVLNYNF